MTHLEHSEVCGRCEKAPDILPVTRTGGGRHPVEMIRVTVGLCLNNSGWQGVCLFASLLEALC